MDLEDEVRRLRSRVATLETDKQVQEAGRIHVKPLGARP